jgi:hypothetical protein
MMRLECWLSSLSGLFLSQGGRPTFHAHKTYALPRSLFGSAKNLLSKRRGNPETCFLFKPVQ